MSDVMAVSAKSAADPADTNPKLPYSKRRVRVGLTVTLVGFLVFLIGIRPAIFGFDRSPVIGFVQLAVMEVGLAMICLGGYTSLMALWKNQTPTIAVDLGLRIVTTGYVVAVFTGMADVFGIGSHALPGIPYFGEWQALGVEIGQIMIGIGFMLLIPYSAFQHKKETPKSV